MEHLTEPNICSSGGATGADTEWGQQATLNGHKVIHWSFPGHGTQVPEGQLIRLDDNQLALADDALCDAAASLGKTVPKRPGVARLLKRNFYQVKWSQSCYAVGTITGEGAVAGGTGWAVTMFTHLRPESRRLYVFDQGKNEWYQWMGGGSWTKIGSPPRPEGIWAGIGVGSLEKLGGRR